MAGTGSAHEACLLPAEGWLDRALARLARTIGLAEVVR